VTELEQFISDLMFDLVGDDWGLWEVGASAHARNGPLRDLPAEERERLARAAVDELLNRGWVQLMERRTGANGKGLDEDVEVTPVRVADVLTNTANWNADDVRGSRVRYMVSATERGIREFEESVDRKRRRG
jgi:hypothetical protein